MRQAQVRAVIGQKLDEARIVRKDINRPGLDLRENSWVEIFDLVRHEAMLANVLTSGKLFLPYPLPYPANRSLTRTISDSSSTGGSPTCNASR